MTEWGMRSIPNIILVASHMFHVEKNQRNRHSRTVLIYTELGIVEKL